MADNFSVRIELEEIKRLIAKAGDRNFVVSAASAGLALGMQIVERDVIAERLSGQYLNVITGTARKSIRSRVTERRGRLLGLVGSPLGYVRAHDQGFNWYQNVREHTRATHTRTVRGKTQKVRAHSVRGHERYINMRARHFLRDAIIAKLPNVRQQVVKALREAFGVA